MLRRLAAGVAGRADDLLNEDRIGLAVTGLSRAGKTVFITSLVNNLLALGAGRATLPGLARALRGVDGRSRLRGVRVLEQAGPIAPFDYAGSLARLAAAEPAWPEPTTALAQISLTLIFDRRSVTGRLLGPRRVRLDILDYPGEWLLDLPLLRRDFATWSAETLALLATAPRAALAGRFLGWLAALDPAGPPDAAVLAQGAALYRAALHDAAARGLRYLQPGRLVAPLRGDDPVFFALFPLAGCGATATVLARRFGAYQHDIRRRFFDTHFRRFDRQVVLVDLLSALKAGQAAFTDTAQALREVAQGLHHGWGGFDALSGVVDHLPGAHHLPAPLLGGRVVPRPIGRVAFVATKADHVPAMKRDNLRNLLRAVAGDVVGAGGPAVSYHVAASVVATEGSVARLDGRPVEAVRGVLLGAHEPCDFIVGEVPSGLPPDTFWDDDWFTLPVFRPPFIAAGNGGFIRQLGLDELMCDLIGDRL